MKRVANGFLLLHALVLVPIKIPFLIQLKRFINETDLIVLGTIWAKLTPNYTELDEYAVLPLYCMVLLFSMSLGFLFIIVPVAMSIFGLEVYFLRKTGYKFTWDQTLLNLSLGFFDRLMGLYLTERSLILIEQVVSWRLFPGIEKSIFAFVLTFIGVDFIWYLFHRMGHRVSLM